MPHQSNQIFIRNLDSCTTDNSLESHFKKFGEVKFSKVLRDHSGRSKKCGLVTFAKTSSATMALSSKCHFIDGRKAECRPSRSKQFRLANKHKRRTPVHLRRIYVGNLGPDITGEQLKDHFSKYGQVEYAYVKKDSEGKSKRYGFVLFDDTDAIEEVQKNRPHVINDITVQTLRSYPDDAAYDDKNPTTMLYVMNYKSRIDENDVKKYFRQFGVIVSAASRSKIKHDNEEEYHRYIELEFKDYDIVDKICLKKNHSIKHCNITVKKYFDENSDETHNLDTNDSAAKESETMPSSDLSTHSSNSSQKPMPLPSAPFCPPLEDLHNPGVNPYHNFQQPESSLYPSLPGISYPCSMPMHCELNRALKKSKKNDKNSCIII